MGFQHLTDSERSAVSYLGGARDPDGTRKLTESHKAKIGEAAKRRFKTDPKYRQMSAEALAKGRAIRTEKAKYRHESQSERARRSRYGLTAEALKALLQSQNDRCAICLSDFRGRKMAVDHDHSSGAVRGLLCLPCNGSLGWFERHGDTAAKYIRGNH